MINYPDEVMAVGEALKFKKLNLIQCLINEVDKLVYETICLQTGEHFYLSWG